MNEITLDAVKSVLGNETNARGYRQFSGEARARAVEYATQRISLGATAEEVWLELGLKDWTLQRWLQQARKKPVENATKGFARLEVRAKATAAPRSSLVVLGPGGVRVEGLQLAQVAELFQRLSCSV